MIDQKWSRIFYCLFVQTKKSQTTSLNIFITNTMEYHHASEGLRECKQEETALLIRNGEMVTSKTSPRTSRWIVALPPNHQSKSNFPPTLTVIHSKTSGSIYGVSFVSSEFYPLACLLKGSRTHPIMSSRQSCSRSPNLLNLLDLIGSHCETM